MKTLFKNKTLDGVAKTVINVLRQAIGFDYEIVTPQDGTIGLYNETDGTWSGILGMLKRGVSKLNLYSIRGRHIQGIYWPLTISMFFRKRTFPFISLVCCLSGFWD